jgi:hypothetical protein
VTSNSNNEPAAGPECASGLFNDALKKVTESQMVVGNSMMAGKIKLSKLGDVDPAGQKAVKSAAVRK